MMNVQISLMGRLWSVKKRDALCSGSVSYVEGKTN